MLDQLNNIFFIKIDIKKCKYPKCIQKMVKIRELEVNWLSKALKKRKIFSSKTKFDF